MCVCMCDRERETDRQIDRDRGIRKSGFRKTDFKGPFKENLRTQ